MNKVLIIVLVFGTIIIAACSASTDSSSVGQEVSVNGGTYTNITVPELESMLEEKDFTFVNVHIPFEGDIPNTDLFIQFDQIDQNLDLLPADKDAKIFGYVAGLGGRDIPETTIEKICTELLQSVNSDRFTPAKPWIDTAENAMEVREARVKAPGAERRAQGAQREVQVT